MFQIVPDVSTVILQPLLIELDQWYDYMGLNDCKDETVKFQRNTSAVKTYLNIFFIILDWPNFNLHNSIKRGVAYVFDVLLKSATTIHCTCEGCKSKDGELIDKF